MSAEAERSVWLLAQNLIVPIFKVKHKTTNTKTLEPKRLAITGLIFDNGL